MKIVVILTFGGGGNGILKTVSTFYSKNPLLTISFEGDFPGNVWNPPSNPPSSASTEFNMTSVLDFSTLTCNSSV